MMRLGLLAALLFVLAPIALHLWTRARPRRLDWAAWRFLPEPDPADERIVRLEHPSLLLLRLLALLLAVIAAAGPTCSRPDLNSTSLGGVQKPRFLLDVSASMGIGQIGERPIDRAAQKLDDWWRTHSWNEGDVYVCRNSKAEQIYNASQVLPRRFLGILEPELRLGQSDLETCMQTLTSDVHDLIILSDQAPRDGWQGFRSAHWHGVAAAEPPVNSGFGQINLSFRGNLARIEGQVLAPQVQEVDLIWQVPARPQARAHIEHGQFRFELLVPREDGRILLQLHHNDAAAWDNILPLWLPAGGRPRVKLLGDFAAADERLLLDLLYAASDRIHLDFSEQPVADRAGKRIYIVADIASVESGLANQAYLDIASGSIAVVFPSASANLPPHGQKWVPGWLHPAQPSKEPGLRPSLAMTSLWPELESLDWSGARIANIHPLADPDPAVQVLLETTRGLPVLLLHRVGAGTIYTWTIDLNAQASNLARTPLWVPLWLAMMESLSEQAVGAELLHADAIAQSGLQQSERVELAYRDERGGGSLSWLRAKRDQTTILLSERVAASEVLPGTYATNQILKATGGDSTPTETIREPYDLHWLTAAVVVWLLQGAWAQRLALLLLAFVLTLASPSFAFEQSQPLQVWLPEESGVNPNHINGMRAAIESWRMRASPDVQTEPKSFAWRSTDPSDPWVWWAGCKRFEPENDPRLATALRRFLRGGGTLWLDFCGGPAEFRRYAQKIGAWFEQSGLGGDWRELNNEHVLWRTFYLLNGWLDHEETKTVYALHLDGLDRVFLFGNLARGLARDPLGGLVLPLSPELQEWQLRQGLNLLMYTTTYDYKNDNIHLPYILERRRRHR